MSNILRHLHMGCGESLRGSTGCAGLDLDNNALPQVKKPQLEPKAKVKKASRRK